MAIAIVKTQRSAHHYSKANSNERPTGAVAQGEPPAQKGLDEEEASLAAGEGKRAGDGSMVAHERTKVLCTAEFATRQKRSVHEADQVLETSARNDLKIARPGNDPILDVRRAASGQKTCTFNGRV